MKSKKLLSKKKAKDLFDTLAANINPESELNWQTPLDLLIAVVLSAQTTDKSVNKVTEVLWQTCRLPKDYIDLGEDKVRDIIKTIGLYRNKAKSVIGICEKLLESFNGEVPQTREELQSFPGVGRKTANVVLNVVFKQPVMAVDTHVFRVSNRIGLADTTTPEKTEDALMKIIPKAHLLHAHHYLILHGRYVCKARKPNCPECCVSHICLYKEKTL